MKKYILTTIICMISLLSFADNTALYLRLDSVPCVGKSIYELMVELSSITMRPDVIKSAGILAIHFTMGLCSQV